MKRRLGRPTQGDAAETRQRILDEARRAFTARGYDSTTNREIALGAGITAAAIYHYFPSKVDLYVAVFVSVQEKVFEAFDAAVASRHTFLEQFDAIFDAMCELGEHDPMLASFVVGVITEASHHPELRKELSKLPPRQEIFLSELCTNAKSRGELPESLPVQSAIDAMSGVIAGFSRLAVTVRDRERLLAAATVYKSMARSALSRAGV
jgi:AcrR family transcriptional regulator